MSSLPRQVQVAIVGGGPAGLTTALSLIRNAPHLADRVVVFEAAAYPRDKICAGGLGRRADALLGLLGVTAQVPSVPVHGFSLRLGVGSRVVRTARRIGRVVRRIEFDEALARAAIDCGVRIVQGVRVTAVRPGHSQHELQTAAGDVRARVVVGADGIGSVVRRSFGLAEPGLRAQVVEVDTPASPADPDRGLLHFESADPQLSGYTWDFPTLVDGREMVCRGAYVLKLGSSSPDASTVLAKHLESRGLQLGVFRQKRYAERSYDTGQRLSWPGVLLVGEAAGIDPVTGEGIPQAIAYGEKAGRYLAGCLQEGDLRFERWGDEVGHERFGWDLGVRLRLVPLFYGDHREWMERVLIERPWFLQAGMEYFAGRRVPRALVARVIGQAAWLALRHQVIPRAAGVQPLVPAE